jgi:FtsP/CotA-like multicopper oxidase with cupredoxin domain
MQGAPAGGMQMQAHPASETGNPLVDMQTMTPEPRLSDPGIGLRGNGRTVATYADLKSLFEDPDGREPGRTVELHLTGSSSPTPRRCASTTASACASCW